MNIDRVLFRGVIIIRHVLIYCIGGDPTGEPPIFLPGGSIFSIPLADQFRDRLANISVGRLGCAAGW
jgi:hypothetical protein